ncbi:50S ribosomal subunit protein L32 [Candidatus Xenohaliotis californiensis]|uniref:Large ribosomal subunit protein bL32 n=1 Tax=Candidatus Xenohaliotis californiensis TaxID=84677 RepID=A0ABM9N9I8_9RICK|nr:50S ribosomal subunit protein L32 [Candidatus Xenohaliotis californiensis]
MAVPKRKTSKSKRNMRRANKGLKPVFYGFNSTTGEITLPHRVSLDGYYKGWQIISKNKNTDDENGDSQ